MARKNSRETPRTDTETKNETKNGNTTDADEAADGTDTSEGPPLHCERPPDATGEVPDTVQVLGSRVRGQGHRLPRSLGRILSLAAIRAQDDMFAEAAALPQNSDKVPGAAEQMLDALHNEPDAGSLEVQ